jgi:hypothetical protein
MPAPFDFPLLRSVLRHGLAAVAAAGCVCPLSAQDAATPGDGDASSEGASAALFPPDLMLEDPPSLEGLEGPPPPPAPNGAVVVNLINRLVEKGILSPGEAADMMIQAQRDAEIATQNAATAALVAEDMALEREDDVVVSYVPEPVRERMKEELRIQVMEQARAEGWAAPGSTPEWVQRMDFFADFRSRYDGTMFPDGNDATGSFPDFNRINRGDPFDVAGTVFSPQRNVNEDRPRFRLRARFGADMDLGHGFTFGTRVATGSDISPVSHNQTLGGEFQKYQLWLDQAFLRWNNDSPNTHAVLTAGRMPNPFFRVSPVIWDDDLNFDGFAVHLDRKVSDRFNPFLNAGVFPVFTSSSEFNGPHNQPQKFDTLNKWLQSVQIGARVANDANDVSGQFGVAFYNFDNVEGKLSDPFIPLTSLDAGSTDDRRPTFAQKGNTYMPLRTILADPLNDFGTRNQFQYFGLASKFQLLSYSAKLDLDFFEPARISLFGDYSTNLAFVASEINRVAVNNRGPLQEDGSPGEFDGGGNAWSLGVRFGPTALAQKGDWDTYLSYRFVESDAAIDGFADSAFGLGGTNMEGFTIGGSYALTPKVNLGLRWFGANEITGPPLKSDIIQLDLNARF